MGDVMLLSKVDGIDLWKDPPYMLGGVEIPGLDYDTGEDLGDPDESLTLDKPLLPDRYTNRYEIKIDGMIGDDITCYRYMRMNVPQEGEDDFSVYCWITDVVRNAATGPACIIRYEIDYWRTYLPKLSFGRGEITRCALEEFKRPYGVQPRHRKITDIIPLNPTQETVSDGSDIAASWIIVVYTVTNDGVTTMRKAFFPIGDNYGTDQGASFVEAHMEGVDIIYTTVTAPSAGSVYEGRFDEAMGIDPASVVGVYLSPICPSSGYTSWNAGRDAWVGFLNCRNNGVNWWMEEPDSFSRPWEYELGGEDGITPDDVTSYIITGMQGEIMGSLPYGVTVTAARIAVDCGASGAYLHVSFVSSLSPDGTDEELYAHQYNAGSKLAGVVGLAFTIPLPAIPVTQNAWSSYVYSGQRELDIESAKIARDQNLINGLTGVISGGTTGGLMGSVIKQTVRTAGIGALAGAAVTAGVTGAQYAIQRHIDDRLQDAQDRRYANQTANLILSGGSRYYLLHSELTGQKNLHGVC